MADELTPAQARKLQILSIIMGHTPSYNNGQGIRGIDGSAGSLTTLAANNAALANGLKGHDAWTPENVQELSDKVPTLSVESIRQNANDYLAFIKKNNPARFERDKKLIQDYVASVLVNTPPIQSHIALIGDPAQMDADAKAVAARNAAREEKIATDKVAETTAPIDLSNPKGQISYTELKTYLEKNNIGKDDAERTRVLDHLFKDAVRPRSLDADPYFTNKDFVDKMSSILGRPANLIRESDIARAYSGWEENTPAAAPAAPTTLGDKVAKDTNFVDIPELAEYVEKNLGKNPAESLKYAQTLIGTLAKDPKNKDDIRTDRNGAVLGVSVDLFNKTIANGTSITDFTQLTDVNLGVSFKSWQVVNAAVMAQAQAEMTAAAALKEKAAAAEREANARASALGSKSLEIFDDIAGNDSRVDKRELTEALGRMGVKNNEATAKAMIAMADGAKGTAKDGKLTSGELLTAMSQASEDPLIKAAQAAMANYQPTTSVLAAKPRARGAADRGFEQ